MTAPTRSLSKQLAPLVAELELRQPTLVTLDELALLAEELGLRTPAKVVAARLRATGWLLRTVQRGIYEFAPGSHAGPFGHGDPFIDLRAAMRAERGPLVVALHSALWLHGMAERAPDRHELAVPVGATARVGASLLPEDAIRHPYPADACRVSEGDDGVLRPPQDLRNAIGSGKVPSGMRG